VNNAGIGLGSIDIATVVNVNTLGVKRVCEAFLPLLEDGGRIVNVSSASAPNFVSQCSPRMQAFFQDPTIEWPAIQDLIDKVLDLDGEPEACRSLGLGDISAYGLSKACASLYTVMLAREHPQLIINACTPGYIETDLTRPSAEARGAAPADLGMKPPSQGTAATLFLLFGQPRGSGHYYGSDAKRSPLDRYRAPGDPEYCP
jgi:NAD(P)-dependent dehydrogenase (short-subunit alcohol dehydrogenase family)